MKNSTEPTCLRLICFPYAGGSIAHFQRWQDYLLPGINIEQVHLPGHGPRVGEAAIDRMEPLASQLASELQLSAGDCFAFFGHSMGALVSFEVARRLEERGLSGPVMLFASGCAAPQVFDINPKIHDLPDDEFTRRLKSLEGTPPEVLAHQELMSLVLPALRADFAVCETYQYCSGKPLDCPVFAWGGSADPEVDFEALEPWREQTSKKFSMKILEGRHFFLHDQWPAMVRTLNRMLSPWCTPANHVLAPPGGRCSSQRTGRSGLHTQTQHSTRRGSVRQHRI